MLREINDWKSFKNSQDSTYDGVHFIKFANLECTDCNSIANLKGFTTNSFWKMLQKLGLLKTFSKSLWCNGFTSWALQRKACSFISNEVHVRPDWGSAEMPMYPKGNLLDGNFFPGKTLKPIPVILLKVDSITEIFWQWVLQEIFARNHCHSFYTVGCNFRVEHM